MKTNFKRSRIVVRSLTCFFLLQTSPTVSQSYQSYQIKEYYDDQEEYQTNKVNYSPITSGIESIQLERTASQLESFIRLYQVTGDKAYLFKFIDHAAEIISLRGTFFPATIRHGTTSWSHLQYINGFIMWPMAHFVHLVKKEEITLQSVILDPLPCSVPGQPCLDLATSNYSSMGEFAKWLSDRVDESLIYAIDNYWYSNTRGFRKSQSTSTQTGAMAMNMQAPLATTLLYMADANSNATYLTKAYYLARMYTAKNITLKDICVKDFPPCKTLNFPSEILIDNAGAYTWYHLSFGYQTENCFFCHGSTQSPDLGHFTQWAEDVGHMPQDLVFPYLAYKLGLNDGSGAFFTDVEMTKFKNTLTDFIWKGPSDPFSFYNNVDGTDSPSQGSGTNAFLLGVIGTMPLYKWDAFGSATSVYDVIMSHYLQHSHNKDINHDDRFIFDKAMGYWALSTVVEAQWDKECPDLTLKKRMVVYDQDFTSQGDLFIRPGAPNIFNINNINSFAEPKIDVPKFTIENDATVNMIAVNKIVLEQGFHVKSGSTFRAYLDPFACSSSCRLGHTDQGQATGEASTIPDGDFSVELQDELELEGVSEELLEGDQGITLRNYPNPFQDHTHIEYTTNKKTKVKIAVRDVFGQEIAVLVEQYNHRVGNHDVTFNATDLPGGIYYCSMEIGTDVIKTIRIISVE